jgi:hypothetical protein
VYYYKISVTVPEGEGGQSAAVNARTLQAPVTPPGATLVEQLAYIRNNAGDGTVFNIIVNNNEYIGPQTVSTMGRNITVNIRSVSSSDVKIIQLEGQGYLFSVDAGITLKLQDIVLRGHSTNNRALVAVGNGTLVLNSGTKITQNTNTTSNGGGIYVNGGILEMNDGAEIIGNEVRSDYAFGGGIYVMNRGNIIIKGGVISENGTYTGILNPWWDKSDGGGIYITGNSTVTMTGGIISKNIATGRGPGMGYDSSTRGGGVYIHDNGSSFIKRANPPGSSSSGIIYGGGTGTDANTTGGQGHAIHRNWGSLKNRNTTLSGFDEISTGNDVGWE